MTYPVETVVERLLPTLFRLEGDAAKCARESLIQLLDSDAFSLAGHPTACAENLAAISDDQRLTGIDYVVATTILSAFSDRTGSARLSLSEIGERSRVGLGQVRSSLRRLVQTGYFSKLRPTQWELMHGDSRLQYRPCFTTRVSMDDAHTASTGRAE